MNSFIRGIILIIAFCAIKSSYASTALHKLDEYNDHMQFIRNNFEADQLKTVANKASYLLTHNVNFNCLASIDERFAAQKSILHKVLGLRAQGKQHYSLKVDKNWHDERYIDHIYWITLNYMSALFLAEQQAGFLYTNDEVIAGVNQQLFKLFNHLKIKDKRLVQAISVKLKNHNSKITRNIISTKFIDTYLSACRGYSDVKNQWLIEVRDIEDGRENAGTCRLWTSLGQWKQTHSTLYYRLNGERVALVWARNCGYTTLSNQNYYITHHNKIYQDYEDYVHQRQLKNLPREIWSHIFSYMNLQENIINQTVCSTWSLLASDERLWGISNLSQYFFQASDFKFKIKKLNSNQHDMLIKQYNLYIKMFILNVKGKAQQAQTLLQSVYSKLFYTSFIHAACSSSEEVRKHIFSQSNDSIPHHDASQFHNEIYNIIYNPLAEPKLKESAFKSHKQLVNQRYKYAVLDYLYECVGDKSNGFPRTDNAFAIDIKSAHELCEQLIKEEGELSDEALTFKIQGLAKGIHGFHIDKKAAQDIVEYNFNLGNENGLFWKIEGLDRGEFGYDKDENQARKLIESLINQNNKRAFYSKIQGLVEGKFGYLKNIDQAKEMLKSVIIDRNSRALYCYYRLLWDRDNPEETRELACNWIDLLIDEGIEWATNQKLQSLIAGWNSFEKNETLAHEFIEQQAQFNHGVSKVLKAIGLAYGAYGYKKDSKAAIDYILQEKVQPYELQVNFRLLQ